MSVGAEKLYFKEWLYFKRHGSPSDSYASLLLHGPTNAFQLSLWCDVVLFARIESRDVPNEAIFYLYDHVYKEILHSLSETLKNAITYKIQLLEWFLELANHETNSVIRRLDECLMIADSSHKMGQNQQTQELRVQILCEYLSKNTNFSFPGIARLLASHISNSDRFRFVKGRSRVLHDLDQISLINIVINNLCDDQQVEIGNQKGRQQSESRTQSVIKQFLLQNKKSSVCFAMKQHILKSNRPELVEILFELLSLMGIREKVFKYESMTAQNIALSPYYSEDEFFYAVFLRQFESGTISRMKNFQKFMLSYLAGQTIVLYRMLIVDRVCQPREPESTYSQLHHKNLNVFSSIFKCPRKMVSRCLDFYLSKSRFNNPYQTHRSHRSSKSVSLPDEVTDPFLFLPIESQLWNDPFHSQVLSLCLWLTLDHWLLYVQSLKQTSPSTDHKAAATELQRYRKDVYLTFFQMVVSYKINIFINYCPIQKRFLEDIITLPSFCELILSNTEFLEISWFNFVISAEFPHLLGKQHKSYELLVELIRQKSNFEELYGNFPLAIIESELQSQKPNKNIQSFNTIVDYYAQKNNSTEQATHLKIMLSSYNS